MKPFKEGATVRVNTKFDIKLGRVLRCYDDLKVAVVEFENGVIEKTPYYKMVLDTDGGAQAVKKTSDGSVIIERKDFEKQLSILTESENLDIESDGKLVLIIASKILSRDLVNDVFGAADAVRITRSILLNKIEKVTNPKDMRSGGMTLYDALIPTLCLAVVTVFSKLIVHYFGDDCYNA